MLEVQTIQGRPISHSDITQIQGLIERNPRWSRWRLSRELAESWQWYAASGQLKDMAARTLLLKLQAQGVLNDGDLLLMMGAGAIGHAAQQIAAHGFAGEMK